MIAVNLAYFLALLIRFDFHLSSIPATYYDAWRGFSGYYTVICIFIFWLFKLYRSIWRYASFDELNRVFVANLVTFFVQVAGTLLFVRRMPISYYLIGLIIQMILTIAVRFSYRFVTLLRSRDESKKKTNPRGMIIGAGDGGHQLIRELNSSKAVHVNPICIIDDNLNKRGRFIEGVPVVGGRYDIEEAARKYNIDEIIFAIPSCPVKDQREILDICSRTNCKLSIVPGIYQIVNGEVQVGKMRPVDVEDLLGRAPIKVDMEEIYEHIQGQTILVTGGGGSIGSELCRQIAKHSPKQLIILDIYENNAYDIQLELKNTYPNLNLVTLIGSVRDSRRMDEIMKDYRPDIVFHAAAHKHVPLMEDSPNEAIKNNVVGTYKTAYAAMKYGVKKFVLISTDKAVNPANIMGASKRLCEMVIQSLDEISVAGNYCELPTLQAHLDDEIYNDDVIKWDGIPENKTRFVAVRFGNVLGSNGSVIPLFKKQIANGGPVTVTHPDIIRYFMTIPEAVSLVLQAAVYAKGGEIFVLDMGEPVKIDTLARNLITLSGYTPDKDIKIVYTGLRPGEKLYEEKLMAEEGIEKTANDLIYIGKPIPFDTMQFLGQLDKLAMASYGNSDDIVKMVEGIVPTFHPVGQHPTGKENLESDCEEAKTIEMDLHDIR